MKYKIKKIRFVAIPAKGRYGKIYIFLMEADLECLADKDVENQKIVSKAYQVSTIRYTQKKQLEFIDNKVWSSMKAALFAMGFTVEHFNELKPNNKDILDSIETAREILSQIPDEKKDENGDQSSYTARIFL